MDETFKAIVAGAKANGSWDKKYPRPWVDLTKEEKQECVNKSIYHTAWSSDVDLGTLIDAVGAMLKEKNA